MTQQAIGISTSKKPAYLVIRGLHFDRTVPPRIRNDEPRADFVVLTHEAELIVIEFTYNGALRADTADAENVHAVSVTITNDSAVEETVDVNVDVFD